jgi:hypothetical protein
VWKGVPKSASQRQKLKELNVGKKLSASHRRKLAESKRDLADEVHQHMQEGASKRPPVSSGTRELMSVRQGGPSLCGVKVTREFKDAIMATRPGHCELCGCPPAKKFSLCLDHNHETGELRGWLCHKCNTSIGGLGDDADGLRRAFAYLERSWSPLS